MHDWTWRARENLVAQSLLRHFRVDGGDVDDGGGSLAGKKSQVGNNREPGTGIVAGNCVRAPGGRFGSEVTGACAIRITALADIGGLLVVADEIDDVCSIRRIEADNA